MKAARRIEVQVESFYLPDHSEPGAGRYAFGYLVTVTNHGPVAVQLLDRHWIITDGLGRIQEVRGKGVIGEQPRILPGESYQYGSYCPLATPYGYMEGSYGMVDDRGESFRAEIPMFTLGLPKERALN